MLVGATKIDNENFARVLPSEKFLNLLFVALQLMENCQMPITWLWLPR